MKLNEFAKDDKLDELIGTLAKGAMGLAKGIGKAAIGTTAALAKSSGTSSDIAPGGALRGGGKDFASTANRAQSQAEKNKEIMAAQKEMQDVIREKEKEIQELRKQMSELQRQR